MPSFSHAKIQKPDVKQSAPPAVAEDEAYTAYVDFFKEVFQVVQENYYKPVPPEALDRFIEKFRTKIYSQLKDTGKTADYVRWRSAALLIDSIKDPEDVFSAFYPPEPAKEYEGSALAKTVEIEERMELGVSVKKIPQGFMVDFIEPRSDAYEKGLRENDLLMRIDGKPLTDASPEEVLELLRPLVSATVKIDYVSYATREPQSIEVMPKEFFKQTVFPIRTKTPGIYGLELKHFNRKTGEDVLRFLSYFRSQGNIEGLILDLRDNPGGPPLAARELSSFFMTPGADFAYFQKKNQPKALLDVPEIPEQFRYQGPVVILVNKQSGSAAELFSGIMQRQKRAVLIGQPTAGQVMLKSMFHFADESMVVLITARGHHPDGKIFSFSGLTPNRAIGGEENIDLIEYAQKYFIYTKSKQN